MRLALALLTLTSFCSAIPALTPTIGLEKRAPPSGADPSFTIPQSTLDANIVCPLQPKGFYAGVTNPVLLVPGTGTTGSQSWDHTYVPLTSKLGYQPCYISPPPQMLGDLQDASEYFVNAVHRLNAASKKKVPVITWSAGGLVAQWSATFFPSIRSQIDRKISFAPDFRGTIEAYLLTGLNYIEPSIWQQATLSHYILTLANAGGLSTSYTPTTTIYSSNDEIVEPETPNQIASSYLASASNFLVQDYCGPTFILEHSQELFNSFTYKIAKAALASASGTASAASVTAADCTELPPAQLTPEDVIYDVTIIPQAGAAILEDPKVSCEPPIRAYAKPYDPIIATGGICFNNPPQSRTYANAKGFTAPFNVAQVSDYIVGSNATTAQIKKAVGL